MGPPSCSAGSLQGSTQTLPLAVYSLFDANLDQAIAIGVLLIIVSAAILLISKLWALDLLEIDIALPRRAFKLRVPSALGRETIALIGPSGAGKTSLLRSVAGLDRPRAGRIGLRDEVWFDASRKLHVSPERRRVGYLPQLRPIPSPHRGRQREVCRPSEDRPDLLERLGIAHLASARPSQL